VIQEESPEVHSAGVIVLLFGGYGRQPAGKYQVAVSPSSWISEPVPELVPLITRVRPIEFHVDGHPAL